MKALWILTFSAFFIWSGYEPRDMFTWFLEVFPAIVGVLILAATYHSFKLTPLLYVLILLHCIILMIGGHYTYAEVPAFEGLFGWERNNFDKFAHFAQGFIPAMITREIFLRKQVVNGDKWRFFLIVCVCLAVSAFYEMIEWWVAAASGSDAVAFLATQGYVWDTQSDMALAMVGAIVALLTLRKIHDAQLQHLVK